MTKALTEIEINQQIKELKKWEFKDGFIFKKFVLHDFKEAFALMTRIAFYAEEMQHHPNWENVYNEITIKLQTHDVKGITQKDFDLAHQIEKLI